MANEKRLIDAKAKLIQLLASCGVVARFCELERIARELIDNDVEPVVRCKDCKHLKYGYQCYYPLGMMLNNDGDAYVLVDPDEDFCSYGERKDNG